MKRILGVVALVLGAFLLMLGALSKFYIYDQLALAPLDTNSTSTSETIQDAEYFDIAGGLKVTTGPLRSVRVTVADKELSAEASKDLGADIAVYDTFSQVDKPDFDFGSGETALSASHEIIAFDRVTGETVEWDKTRIMTGGLTVRGNHKGLFFKFPFNTQKKTYQFWDGSIKEATDAVFDGEDTIDGLKVYRFVQTIEPTKIGTTAIPGALIGDERPNVVLDRMYSNVRTLEVEPETGAIIRGGESQDSWFELNGERKLTATTASLSYTEDYVQANVDDISGQAFALRTIRTTLPLWGSIIGVLLIIGGFFLARKPKEASAE